MSSKDDPTPALPTGAELLDYLFDSIASVALFTLDPQGLVTDWSAGAEHLLGYRRFEIPGNSFAALFTEEDKGAGFPQQLITDAAREGRLNFETAWLRSDGRLIRCAVTLEPRLVQDQLAGFIVAVQDLTRLRSTETELADAREKLQQMHKLELIGQLASGAAHDFTIAISLARDTLERLRQDDIAPDERDLAARTLDETLDRAATLANRLLTFGHEQPLRAEEFDVVECLLGLRSLLESSLGDMITLKLHLVPDLIPINADRHHFETALLNLVTNARDAIMSGAGRGRITISVKSVSDIPPIRSHPGETGSFAAVSVSDNGPGIPDDIRSRIFSPFFSTKADKDGAGLGLAQVLSFAQRSGGNVDISAASDQGSTFTLYLPRVTHRAVSAIGVDTEAKAGPPAQMLTGEILLVEDNARIAEMTEMMLRDIGLSPNWARDAEEALARLHQREGKFDLVLTDIVMPRMSGIALARIIANRWPDLPVVLVSGYSDDLTAGYGGHLELLQKPFTRKGLAAALARHLKTGEQKAPAAAPLSG